MKKVRLEELRPSESMDIYEMAIEIGQGENGFVNGLYCDSLETFQERIAANYDGSRGIGLTAGRVPQTLYWLYVNDRPVGYGKLRHCLNEHLKQHGGHIGYVIRPSERGKGY